MSLSRALVCVHDISCIKARQRKKEDKCLPITRVHERGCAVVSLESESRVSRTEISGAD